MNRTLFDIPVFNWLMATATLALTTILLNTLKSILLNRLGQLLPRSTTDLDEFVLTEIRSIRGYFILALGLYLAALVLGAPSGVSEFIRVLTVTALLLQLAVWGQELISFLVNRRMRIRMETDPASATTLSAFNLIARIILWVVILLLVLDNLPGIQITSLVASLGISGVAVALAVQNILGDLFASLSIAMDKPFVIGDFITIDSYQGTVEYIGLKSTRLRSLEGEQLVFSNSDLLRSRIRNFKRMKQRRVMFSLRLRPDTPPEKLTVIPDILRDIINAQEKASFDRAHFKEIGLSALLYEVVYFVDSPEYRVYMDIQQCINLEVSRRFAEDGIHLAFSA